jgi:hypothetical protein
MDIIIEINPNNIDKTKGIQAFISLDNGRLKPI